MKVIVAYYNEDLKWLEELKTVLFRDDDIIIYNKSNSYIDKYLFEDVREYANVGREAHSYLSYIVDNYFDIQDDYYCFLQGHPEPHSNFEEIKGAIIDSQTNYCKKFYYPLGEPKFTDYWGFPNHFLPVGLTFLYFFNQEFPTCNQLKFIPGSQFIVHAERIKRYPRNVYERMLEFSLAPEGPWIIERMWHYMFGR